MVGVDGREAGWRALDWAAQEALAHCKVLNIYHCCWQATHRPGTEPYTVKALLDDAVMRALEAHPTLTVRGDLLEGRPASALAARVTAEDLLVLGLRSTHRLTARLLGSTASRLLTHARCAVAVLPPSEPARKGRFSGHVVAAVDGSHVSKAVVAAAFDEAVAHHWPLALVHAEPPIPEPSVSYVDENALEIGTTPYPAEYDMLHEAIEPWHHRYPHVVVPQAAFRGRVADVLRVVAVGAEILVLGHVHHPLRPLSLVDLVLDRVRCPVLVTAPPTTPVVGTFHSGAPAARAERPLRRLRRDRARGLRGRRLQGVRRSGLVSSNEVSA